MPQDRPRILMLTPLDYLQASNNREHNAARFYARTCDVTLIARRMNRTPGLAAFIRDCLTFHTNDCPDPEAPGVRLVTVDALLNYFAGVATSSEPAGNTANTTPTFSPKRIAASILRPVGALRDLCYVPCVWWTLLRRTTGTFDAAVAFGPWGALGARLAKSLGRCRRIVYIDRDYEPGLMPDRLRRSYTEHLERVGVRKADAVVSIGHRLADLRRSQTDRTVHVIPTGVDAHRFASTAKARADRDPGRTLVYVGNVISWAGLDIAIRALSAIRVQHPGARLVIIGAGLPTYERSLRDLADELGVTDAIDWRGRVPYAELPQHLAGTDIGLAASQPNEYRQYAYPLKVIEYMAAGLPSIVTRGTEAQAIVETHGTGLACDFTAESFAAAACDLLSDPDTARRMSGAGPGVAAMMAWVDLLARELDIVLDRARTEDQP